MYAYALRPRLRLQRPHGHIHADGNCDSNVYAYSDRHGYIYAYGDGDGYIHAYSDRHGYIHAYRNCNCYSYCNSYGNSDRTAAAFTDATASADTAASPLALLRNLRELARTNSRVPRLRSIRPPQWDDDKLISEGADISRKSRFCYAAH